MSRLVRHPFLVLGIIIFLTITVLVVFRLSTGAKADTKKARLITVGVVSPLRQDLDIHLTYTADISPNQVVNIFSRVDGYIAKLHVDKGDFVRANQLLVEIDHTDYHHAVNQAKANLLAAKAKVSQQNAMVRNAKLTFDRMQTLIKDQFVSQQDLDNAQVNLDAARAAHESLQAQVNQMEVALARPVVAAEPRAREAHEGTRRDDETEHRDRPDGDLEEAARRDRRPKSLAHAHARLTPLPASTRPTTCSGRPAPANVASSTTRLSRGSVTRRPPAVCGS
jgi:multidrug efflux pump subunit AcrA (membrane-fusion protein)